MLVNGNFSGKWAHVKTELFYADYISRSTVTGSIHSCSTLDGNRDLVPTLRVLNLHYRPWLGDLRHLAALLSGKGISSFQFLY